jgi:hypothetical protein
LDTTSTNDNTISKFIDRYLNGNSLTTSSSSTSSIVTPSPPISLTTTTSALLRKLNNLDSILRIAREHGSSTVDSSDSATTNNNNNNSSNNNGSVTNTLSMSPISPASESNIIQWYSPNTSPMLEQRTLHSRHEPSSTITTMPPQFTSHGTITTTLLSSTLPTHRNVLEEEEEANHNDNGNNINSNLYHQITPPRLSNSSTIDSSTSATTTTGYTPSMWHTLTWNQYNTIHPHARGGELVELPLPPPPRHTHREWNHPTMNGGSTSSLSMVSSNTEENQYFDKDTIIPSGGPHPYYVNYGVRATASSSHGTNAYPHHHHGHYGE